MEKFKIFPMGMEWTPEVYDNFFNVKLNGGS